jgi:hypothetical protein
MTQKKLRTNEMKRIRQITGVKIPFARKLEQLYRGGGNGDWFMIHEILQKAGCKVISKRTGLECSSHPGETPDELTYQKGERRFVIPSCCGGYMKPKEVKE